MPPQSGGMEVNYMVTVSILVKDICGPNGKILVCRRKADGVWELPSGKVRTNETPERFISRIAWEQLGVDVTVGILQMRGRKSGPNALHNFHEYYEAVNTWGAEPKSDVYDEMTWVHPSEMSGCAFEGDDRAFLAKYCPWVTGGEISDVRMR
jgi:ADP-ribose pyrophosphatase YjhB (NUDIX family)